MNETLSRSPSDDRSIQNTENESKTITTRGMMTRRLHRRTPLHLNAHDERRRKPSASGVGGRGDPVPTY